MVRCLIFLFVSAILAAPSYADVRVLVSIKPLQLIAEAIVDEDDRVDVLIPAEQSPHHYAMKPSDRVALETAHLILWVGPELETFLANSFARSRADQQVLELGALDDLNLLDLRLDLVGRDTDQTAQPDPHLWLDTANALQIAQHLKIRLAQLSPAKESVYQENLAEFSRSLVELNDYIDLQMQGAVGKPYIVYHDAFQYLEHQYALRPLLALVEDSDLQPGIRHIMNARRIIAEMRPNCLLTDPRPDDGVIATMLGGKSLYQARLDILGSEIAATRDGYIEMMRGIVGGMSGCIAGGQQQ